MSVYHLIEMRCFQNILILNALYLLKDEGHIVIYQSSSAVFPP